MVRCPLKLSLWFIGTAVFLGALALCAGFTAIEIAFGPPPPPPRRQAALPPPPDGLKVPFAWNPVPGMAGYRLYWGTNSRSYTSSASSIRTNAAATGLIAERMYYFAVTSVDVLGMESRYSAEVAYFVSAPKTNLLLTLQPKMAASASGPWSDFGPPLLLITNPPAAVEYYRVTLPQLQRAASTAGPWTNIGPPLFFYKLDLSAQRF